MPNIVYVSHASIKRSIHGECSQIVIETNLSTASGQPSPDGSTVVHPGCVEIMLKQNNFVSTARSLHQSFTSSAE